MRKIIDKIILFFKYLILALISPFRKLKTNKEVKDNKEIKNTDKQSPKEKITTTDNPVSLPDTANVNANPHDTTTSEEAPNSVEKTIPKKIIKLKKIDEKESDQIVFTKELIEELIDEELEDTYKDLDFKVKDATKEQEEDIKELKEKIVPVIEERIEKYNLTTIDEVKEEIKEVVKEEMELKPLFPPIEITVTTKPPKGEIKREKVKEPTPIINKVDRPLDLAPEQPKKIQREEIKPPVKETPIEEEKITRVPKKEEQQPVIEDIKKPGIKEVKPTIKEVALGTVLTTAAIAREIITPPKEEKKPEIETIDIELPKLKEETPVIETEKEITLPEEVPVTSTPTIETKPIEPQPEQINIEPLQPVTEEEFEEIEIEDIKGYEEVEVKPEIEVEDVEEIEVPTVEEHQKDIEDISPEEIVILEEIHQKFEEKETKEEKIEVKKELEDKVETIKEEKVLENKDIDELTEESSITRTEVKKESQKGDFFEKDYDRMEAQINNMLDDIANTLIKYDGKLSERQKNKLKQEESKLREAKANLLDQKERDITVEKTALNAEIHQSEIDGLQEELKRMHFEYQTEADERLLRSMERLEGMTREQVANADKRIMMQRFRKASLLLEMTSLLSFPFIRNKYFFYFTIGLLVDNHFNFINAFWRRKVNKYQPADLSNIRRGIDALDGAIDLTYKNLVQLDYLEEEALSRYPELQYDKAFVNRVTNIRIKLDNNYTKLMKKKQTMEKYMGKTKKQKKILKMKEAA